MSGSLHVGMEDSEDFGVNVRHVGAAKKGERCDAHARLEEIVDAQAGRAE
jgi:hypothetical protein